MSLMCGCDGDRPSVYRTELRKARKQYKCGECYSVINKGDIYDYTFSVWDGSVYVDRMCEKCSDLAASLQELGYCIISGELLEAHREYLEINNRVMRS